MTMSDEQNPPVLHGTELPSVDVWSPRVTVALGQNPSAFTGPGTNSYLVGTGRQRLLLDPGQGIDAYLPVLEQALEQTGCEGIQEIVLTHGHPDHIGGCEQVMARFGPLKVSKFPWPEFDDGHAFELTLLADGDRIETEGATLQGIHTPGHAPDHLCFLLEEEGAFFSGDNVLGVGTTVIPSESGDLGQYMESLDRILQRRPTRIYPAHGPCIEDGTAKVAEYIAHRRNRDRQILEAMETGAETVPAIVKIVYVNYPEFLHAAAGQSVTSHLCKLERESQVTRLTDEPPLTARWKRVSH
jgi:glyoxylase-like metal-dependent hydrolase (beta-lactamase superfamily II)